MTTMMRQPLAKNVPNSPADSFRYWLVFGHALWARPQFPRTILATPNDPKHRISEMFHNPRANASPPSHVQSLLPDPNCLELNSVEQQPGNKVVITAAASGSVAYCSACHHASHSLKQPLFAGAS
jgi:cytochrome c553